MYSGWFLGCFGWLLGSVGWLLGCVGGIQGVAMVFREVELSKS